MNPGAALATRQSSFSKGRLPLAPRSASSPLLTRPNGIGQAAAPSRLGAPQAASGCGNAEDLLTGYAEEVAAPIVYEPRQTTRVPDGAARRESARKMFAPVEVYTGFNSDSDDDCTAPAAAAAARKASNSMIVQSVHAAVRETISKAEAAAQGEVAKRRADAWDMLFEDAPAAKPALNGNRAAKPAGSVRKVERRVMQPVAARSAVAVSDGPAKAGNLVSYGGGYMEETFAPRMRSAQPVQAESTTQASRRTRFATTFAPVEVYTGFTEDD